MTAIDPKLHRLRQHPALHSALVSAPDARSLQPSGYPELDALLGGGWPRASLIEILPAQPGIGELSLLMPALAAISRA